MVFSALSSLITFISVVAIRRWIALRNQRNAVVNLKAQYRQRLLVLTLVVVALHQQRMRAIGQLDAAAHLGIQQAGADARFKGPKSARFQRGLTSKV